VNLIECRVAHKSQRVTCSSPMITGRALLRFASMRFALDQDALRLLLLGTRSWQMTEYEREVYGSVCCKVSDDAATHEHAG
jgi:hypothetical protein